MGDAAPERIPTLAEEWSLPVNEEKSAQSEVPAVSTRDENPNIIASEEVKKSDETTVTHESDATPAPDAEETVENTDIPTDQRTVEAPTEVTTDEAPTEVKTDEAPNEEKNIEAPSVEKTDEVPASEENTETPEEQPLEEEVDEGKPAIKIETAPADFRFPTTNQTRHCFTRYIEYHRCIQAKGEGAEECNKFAKYYRSLCPNEWIERWNEQRENGTFPGPL